MMPLARKSAVHRARLSVAGPKLVTPCHALWLGGRGHALWRRQRSLELGQADELVAEQLQADQELAQLEGVAAMATDASVLPRGEDVGMEEEGGPVIAHNQVA